VTCNSDSPVASGVSGQGKGKNGIWLSAKVKFESDAKV
jgi:hypothetical protein